MFGSIYLRMSRMKCGPREGAQVWMVRRPWVVSVVVDEHELAVYIKQQRSSRYLTYRHSIFITHKFYKPPHHTQLLINLDPRQNGPTLHRRGSLCRHHFRRR